MNAERIVNDLSQESLDSVMRCERSAMFPIQPDSERQKDTCEVRNSMVMNLTRLPEDALARLWHWRLDHPAPEIPLKIGEGVKEKLNEDCYYCDQSKYKVGHFAKNDPLVLQTTLHSGKSIVMATVEERKVQWKDLH